MIICPNCGFNNLEGLLFCEDCGQNLSDAVSATLPTKQVQNDPLGAIEKGTWGSANFGNDSNVVLHVRDSAEPLTLVPASSISLGRYDSSSDTQPDIDFTPYGALDKGVSRHHASIEFTEDTLTLMDNGSSNGTFLNGQRLVPRSATYRPRW